MGKDHAVVWTLANDDIAWCFCTLLLVLCSLNTVTKETAMMARELGRSSPDPRLGSMVELSRGHARGLLDLIRVGKALSSQSIAAEECTGYLGHLFGKSALKLSWQMHVGYS